ncbi:SDR family NAD(P)-dependent oxidoreductase [Thalassotalea maritima]|uniref:SDR family NAD(P)-dependent oxidoreductase n=1 Tax=Thalassotalea maritima TaxID=3242416 RepID=UPI0035288132
MIKPDTQKVALVTGGGSGIGRSISLRLAKAGNLTLVGDLDIESAQETVELIEEAGGQATAYFIDVSNHKTVKEVFDSILLKTNIDILINNAGIAHIGNIEQTGEADMDRLYSVNIKGVYNCISAVIENMKKQKSGIIINMASVASSVGIADRFAYSMSKGAVLTMTYSVAKDYLYDGIRCNCISPGRVHTPFVDNFLEKNYPNNKEQMFEELSKSQPIGRMGTPEEVAALVDYLCSKNAAFITGSNFPVDGGFVTLNN